MNRAIKYRLVGIGCLICALGGAMLVLREQSLAQSDDEDAIGQSPVPTEGPVEKLPVDETSASIETPSLRASKELGGTQASVTTPVDPAMALPDSVASSVDSNTISEADIPQTRSETANRSRPNQEVVATRRMYLAHAPLRQQAIADPDSSENRRILQTMVLKAMRTTNRSPADPVNH